MPRAEATHNLCVHAANDLSLMIHWPHPSRSRRGLGLGDAAGHQDFVSGEEKRPKEMGT